MTPVGTATATHTFKVVVAGSFAVGKSTLIREISDSDVVGTEAPTSGAEATVKGTTTVGMEYGTLTVGAGAEAVELRLHGLPGQDRFRFMWDIVATGADGILLLVDATRPETWAETAVMAAYLTGPATGDANPPLLLAVNRSGGDVELLASVADALGLGGSGVVPCEVVDPDSVREAMVSLLLHVLDGLDAATDPDDDQP